MIIFTVSIVILTLFLWYWRSCTTRYERFSLHHTHGAKIRLLFPVRIFNLLFLWYKRITGGYLLKFKPWYFLGEDHYNAELEIIDKVGPRTMTYQEICDSQKKGLELLCESLNHSHLCWTAIGRVSFLWSHKKEFNARKNLIKYAQNNQEMLQRKVDDNNGLLFITGLPRTGSTFLQTLLSLDPNSRIPRTWEMWYPVPPANSRDSTNHPNVKVMEKDISSVNKVCPNYVQTLRKVHYFAADSPEEDVLFLYHVPWRWNFAFWVMNTSLTDWWFNDDLSSKFACKYLHLCFQGMTNEYSTERIVSKNPGHSYYLESLLAEFPNANIIFTHRHPRKVVPSWSKLCLYSWHLFFQNDFEDPTIHELLTVKGHTKAILQQLSLLAQKLVDSRKYYSEKEPAKEKQFYDVNFQNLISNPVETVKQIYKQFGYEFTEEYHKRIIDYLENQPREKYGRATYSLEELSTDEKEIDQLFGSYIDSYADYF